MDTRLRLTDSLRPGVHEALASTPLVTMAWQALRSEAQRQAARSRRQQEDDRRLYQGLADVAELVPRLRRAIDGAAPDVPQQITEDRRRELAAIADRLEEALRELHVTVVAPEGEPYSAEMMELLENLAQRTDPNARQAWIAEVVAPAVLHHGELLRMGKAVVAVPPSDAPAGESAGESAGPSDPPPADE